MDKIGSRISELIASMGMTRSAFADRMGLSQPYVSQLCSGARDPSDRTISDICREFRVSEDWLRNGIGPMMHEVDEDQEFQDVIAEISISDSKHAERIRRILRAYWAMSEDEKDAIDKLVDSLAE